MLVSKNADRAQSDYVTERVRLTERPEWIGKALRPKYVGLVPVPELSVGNLGKVTDLLRVEEAELHTQTIGHQSGAAQTK